MTDALSVGSAREALPPPIWQAARDDHARGAQMTIVEQAVDETHEGRRVTMFSLQNASGVTARILSYGGTLVSLEAPDRDGRLADGVLGFDDLAGYRRTTTYMGALIGRYANRIAEARFSLGGNDYRLAAND